jgi:hypothetical protein
MLNRLPNRADQIFGEIQFMELIYMPKIGSSTIMEDCNRHQEEMGTEDRSFE